MPNESSGRNSVTNRLYLLRHGENPANLSRQFSNRLVDHPLTEKGVLQARQTADYFAGKKLQAVCSSPLKRATQTAAIIAGRLGLEVLVIEAFREIDVGSLEGRSATDEDWVLHEQIMDEWADGRHDVAFPEGESYDDLWARTQHGLLAATASRANEEILIVGHGGILTITLKDLCPDVDVGWLRTTQWDNCAFAEIDLRRDQDGRLEGRLLTWNSHEHLRGAAAELVPGVPREEGVAGAEEQRG